MKVITNLLDLNICSEQANSDTGDYCDIGIGSDPIGLEYENMFSRG
jgi:hypothetical protein